MIDKIIIKKVSELKEGDLFKFTLKSKNFKSFYSCKDFKDCRHLSKEGRPLPPRDMIIVFFSFNRLDVHHNILNRIVSPTTEVFIG